MSAFYNDNDPFVADWLESLIDHGQIPQGRVDRRSIADLGPADVAGPGQRHFFAGIGGWAYALRLAGVPDDIDIWTGSCPCQGLSDAGQRRGFLDPRHLWPAWLPLIEQCRPPVLFGEQVASTLGLEWLDLVFSDLERCGYAVGAADLCAAGVGAPHARQRLFFVASTPGERLEGVRLRLQQWGPQSAGAEAQRGSEDSGLADATRERRDGEPRHVPSRPEQPDPNRGEPTCGVGDASGQRGGRRRERAAHRRSPIEPPGSGAHGELAGPGSSDHSSHGQLADPDGQGLEVGGEQQAWRQRPAAQRGSETRDLGTHRRILDLPVPPGSTRGFWDPAEWILCRDPAGGPPVARPVEPGAFPLAHGVPGRVGLLRGFGNAIVPEVACEFLLAALESIAQQST